MTETISLDGGAFEAYLARPTLAPGGRPTGAIVLIHEIWGLVGHITGIADRLAAEGYLVIAPDILSRVGVRPQIGLELNSIMTSPDERVRTEGQPRLRDAFAPLRAPEYAEWAIAALIDCVDFLAEQPGINGRIGVMGFCFGGSYSFALAAADARIRVAVPFYGSPPDLSVVPRITGTVRAFYGENDPSLMESLPEVTSAMQSAGVDFSSTVYEGAGHAFFNDTNPLAYREEAAADAWTSVLAILDENLAAD
ncbi:dienelactone hydrolase family protein [Lacisediminihabitans sp.]|jgi:carboxymethylenebutenolidase|uniref:dienelactone hydrolase family protein n=1 Tax=Lacisediminihabitans sp. TaxID=2787631 RepID=UPI002F954F98